MARVLLVDDDPDSLDIARDILASAGHTVVTADTLAGARAQIAADLPDVLLLDLMLPDGNGLELLDEAVESGLRRIVLITGHPGIKSHIRNLSGPSISYLTKPFTAAELRDAVNKAVAAVASLPKDGAPAEPRPVSDHDIPDLPD